jgi:hypothetical protein
VRTPPDKTQIGLSDRASEHLETIRQSGGFRTEQDVYRLAIAIAIAEQLPPTREDITRTTKYSVGSLDPDRALVNAVRHLDAAHGGRPAAYMERLAEAGMERIYNHLDSGKSLGELLQGLASPAPQDT